MKHLKGEKGAALITVLAIIVVSSILITVIYYFAYKGTEVSGLQKRYQTAKEASMGGVEVLAREIIPLAVGGTISGGVATPTTNLSTALAGFNVITSAQVAQGISDACFFIKLRVSTDDTTTTPNWTTNVCDSTLDAKTLPDITFTLSGTAPAQPFDVYLKIVDTTQGNSNTSGIVLEGMGAAESGSGIITSQHRPYIYRIEVQGERQNNPAERANLTVLYAY
jgi:hypothetical protein